MTLIHPVLRHPAVLCTLALSSLLAAGCATTSPGQDAPPLQQQVEAARLPAEHEALARRYERKAEDARALAQDHRRLLKSYQSGSQYPQSPYLDRVGPAGSTATGMPPMPQHCEALARNAEEAARIYSEMAAQHRRWAQ